MTMDPKISDSKIDQGIIRGYNLASAEGCGKHQGMPGLQLWSIKQIPVYGFEDTTGAVWVFGCKGLDVVEFLMDDVGRAARSEKDSEEKESEQGKGSVHYMQFVQI